MAASIGTVAGLCTLIGLGLLVARRRLTGAVFAATTRNDKTMYVVLGSVIVLGLFATVRSNVAGEGYDYRETVSPWFRSLFLLRPDPDAMAGVPVGFQTHILVAFALFAVVLAIVSFLETMLFVVAERQGLLRIDVSPGERRRGLVASLLPVAVFVASIPLAAATNSTIGLLSWISIWPLEALLDRLWPGGADETRLG